MYVCMYVWQDGKEICTACTNGNLTFWDPMENTQIAQIVGMYGFVSMYVCVSMYCMYAYLYSVNWQGPGRVVFASIHAFIPMCCFCQVVATSAAVG